MEYYTIKEICKKLRIKERTLRSWIKKIEERTEFRFSRKINMRNPHFIHGNPVPQLMFDDDDFYLLEELHSNRQQEANLTEAIDRLFLLEEDYNKRYPLSNRG
ncbi:hypothetical protein [Enterococcus sp. LJL51]|uniref:hypothetical protein n=1 Tax=Enterococcus sp. LJL51 TaxID=3416656 RepID=UPI003CEB859C